MLKRFMRELAETVVLAVIILVGLEISVQTYKVEGSSMEPTFDQGQYILVNKMAYLDIDPKYVVPMLQFTDLDIDEYVGPINLPDRGDIVVFSFPRDPSRDFIKRVIGMPGDDIEIRSGEVFVNGDYLDAPYLNFKSTVSMEATKIPMDAYFVLGDNRALSNDSRSWGSVPFDNIKGKAWITYWPLNWL